MKTKPVDSTKPVNWLGLPSPFPHPVSRAAVAASPAKSTLGVLLNSKGDATAAENTDIEIWYDPSALYLKARCHTKAMDRVRKLAANKIPYGRDAWGDDALEIQVDVGRTCTQHRHFILPPNGLPLTFTGFNNRTEQGWHPAFDYRVALEENAWVIEATFPFAILGNTPAKGDIWGLNVMRVNPSEPTGYVQWAPTFGDALRPELFGEIQFSGEPGDRQADIAAYARRASERKTFFLTTLNGIKDSEILQALGISDWTAWGEYLAKRSAPLPLRWEDFMPGRDGIPEWDRPLLLEMADTLVTQIAGWSMDPPDPAAFGIERLESLGDAYLLTGDRRYVSAFEQALRVHARRMEQITATITGPDVTLHYSTNPYYDAQIIRAEMLSYTYLSMRQAGLAPETHATMMRTVLRGCRSAAFNISTAYNYGNHQVYESGGFASVAALFSEFSESDAWAQIASRSIRLHLEREVYPDGGYRERCGYHSVAMSYAMHAVATIQQNGLERRFPELMSPETLAIMKRMHEWLLQVTTPSGVMPAFGDCGASSYLRFFRRGAGVFARPDFAWPLQQSAPAMVPPGIVPRKPDFPPSVNLASHFTILRDGWTPSAFYMAIDHGPLGGQHSHIDTLGFVAYAHGQPVALDSGIGVSYDDARYVDWFRSLRAHNVVAIDDLESEKVAECTFWKSGPQIDIVGLRSRAYEQALKIIHDRVIFFAKGVGWLFIERLSAPPTVNLADHRIDWLLHTPYSLTPLSPGVLHGSAAGGGLLVLAGNPGDLELPQLEQKPASFAPAEVRQMRLWDAGWGAGRQWAKKVTPDITSLTWRMKPVKGNTCEWAMGLFPYAGARPDVQLSSTPDGWILKTDGKQVAQFNCREMDSVVSHRF
jgi:hypothetical protein